MQYLRQSTASQAIKIGPLVDATDGNTPETALTIANTDIKISKNGAAQVSKTSGGATHDAGGEYIATLDATDTNTVGRLKVTVQVAGALMWYAYYTVLEEAVYDAFFAASAPGYVANAPVNVAQFGGSNLTATSGRPEVNLSHIAGSAVSASTAQLGVNLVNVAGAAVSTSTAQLGVNVVNFGGSAGTFASGRPEVNTAYWAGSVIASGTGAMAGLGLVDRGTAQSATATTLVLRSAASFADDALNGATIVITGGTLGVGQRALITDYVGSTDTATVSTWGVTPTGTITYEIYATVAPEGVAQTGDAYARLGAPAGASIAADLAAIEAQTDDIGAAGAGLTAIPWNASWDAEVQSEVADALEVSIADSIPADGTIPSVKQSLYMLTQFMLERSVSSTTVTVRKADGSTSLFTLSLNSATTPTSITRAT